jgi:RNA polymerase sigma-70 factor, ECF subfamily
MRASPITFPPAEEGLCLHLRLIELDPHAPADVCRAYLAPLLCWLAGRYADVDPHLRETAVHEALLGYARRPGQFDPQRGDLATFLRLAARGDLLNLLRREKRHHTGRVSWSVVELAAEDGNIQWGEEEPSRQMERDENAAAWRALLRSLEDGLGAGERLALGLMLDGERKTEAFAAALGVGGLPAGEREREVKRFKDRMKKRLERGGEAWLTP